MAYFGSSWDEDQYDYKDTPEGILSSLNLKVNDPNIVICPAKRTVYLVEEDYGGMFSSGTVLTKIGEY